MGIVVMVHWMTSTSLWLHFVWLQRKSEGEHESSRRLKTQFLIEMEGFDSGSEQILLIGKLLSNQIQLFH